MPGTEVIYESTANGTGNFFHRQCVSAMKGEGDFEFIFVPWFWQAEYSRPTRVNFARSKIVEFNTDGKDGKKAFKQEYPNTPSEAFQVTGEDGLIKPEDVVRARHTKTAANGPLVVGVDPSRGGDRFAVARRRGRACYGVEGHTGDINLGRAVQICTRILDAEQPARMFIDAGGGADLVDRLHELNYMNVTAIPFGGKPLNPERYKNRRCEMWGETRDWLCDENLPVSLPDDDAIQADLCTPQASRDSMDRVVLESKDQIKKRLGLSPDFGDAIALTFAEPVRDIPMQRTLRAKRAYSG
jgi:hypothetical protein